jgi:Cell wall-active antibiotics response 4TMS YvqF
MITEKRKPNQNQPLAIVLIGIGVVIMLMNLGVTNWFTTLRFLQLWPVALIAVGVDIFTRGRYRFMVVLAALVMVLGLYFTGGGFLGTTRVTTEQIEQSLESSSRATVTITSGVSELRVKGLNDSNSLITGKIDLAAGEQAIKQFSKNGDAATYELRSEWPRGRAMNVRNHVWDLALTTRVPLNLTIQAGVGRTTLDLRDMQLSSLDVNTGVGETTVNLATGNYKVNINTGVGTTTIRLPTDVAARVELERGLGAVNVRGDFDKNEDVYTSPDYATAENRIDLQVQGGVGAITIQAGF